LRARVGLTCFACMVTCISGLVAPSYSDTLYLRNGAKYTDVTVVEQTQTDLVLTVSGGATRIVPLHAVAGVIMDSKTQLVGNSSDGKRIQLSKETNGSSSNRLVVWGRRPVHAFVNQQGVPTFTNIPDKYSSKEYEEILQRLQPIVAFRPPTPAANRLLKQALALEATPPERRRWYAPSVRQELDSRIVTYARRYGVRPELVKAIIHAESNFDEQARSDKGAMGLMQLMPRTAAAMGITDAYDTEQNIAGGTQYFSKLLEFFGEERLAIAAYNAGPGRVKEHGGVPPIEETRTYVSRVLKYAEMYKEEMTASL